MLQNKSGDIKKDSLKVLDHAHAQCEKKIEMSEGRAEKLCDKLREECQMLQAENEIVMGKLQAVVESHSECLKKSQHVFEDHDDTIHKMLNESVHREEIFEDKNHQMKYAQESLEKQTNKKFNDLESKVRATNDKCNDLDSIVAKVSLLVNKNLFVSTAVPILGVLFLCFWVHILTVTLPDTIYQETNPQLVEINKKIVLLNNGIKSTDSETFIELQAAKETVEKLEKTVEDRMDIFTNKFTRQFSLLQEKIESYEDSVDIFNSDVDSLRMDLSEQFSSFQSGIIEQFTEASIRYNEFMIPKIWISFASLKDEEGKNKVNAGLNLGLYREDGKERQKPVYKQVDGFYKLIFSADSRWIIVSLDKMEEQEVIIQPNPKVPELSAKKWEVATHKVNIVHEIPCCKTMMMKHSNLTSNTADTRLSLGSLVRGGRGVWQTKQGTVLYFNMRRKQWEVSSSLESDGSGWSSSSSSALCPGEAARQSNFVWLEEKLEIFCT